MTRKSFNKRYDFIGALAGPSPFKGYPSRIPANHPDKKRPRRPRNPATRPSHLKARQRFPTHPLTRIAKLLPGKLPTMAELEALGHEELAGVFLRHCRKFTAHRK